MQVRYFYSILVVILLVYSNVKAQSITGIVSSNGIALPYATIEITESKTWVQADSLGRFSVELPRSQSPKASHTITAHYSGFDSKSKHRTFQHQEHITLNFELVPQSALDEIVITGTLKPILKSDSAVPIEIYTSSFFKKNPSANLFDAINLINGVQPQLNCNVCNTGDIHINGMEGAYTLVLIDGMPIVSSLASVYGLSGIANSMIDRIEVIKGPASSLYGSEAMGGIINVITKDPATLPLFSFDSFTTSWLETNLDATVSYTAGANAKGFLSTNYFKYGHIVDQNKDGFTDVTLQDRISIFNKWTLKRPENKAASLAVRYLYEDRWGGQTHWNAKQHRGSDKVYGESIYTNRFELISQYQVPTYAKIMTQVSYNYHDQNALYGPESYQATQHVFFAQAYWDTQVKKHSVVLGGSYKYTHYDDNTRATGIYDATQMIENTPSKTPLPGVFIQDQWELNSKHTLLMGYRLDYDQTHHFIHSPRLAYKYTPMANHNLRASLGTGFRVVNVFTEDHRALTGARQVVFDSELDPERSKNANLNYTWRLPTDFGVINFDLTGFYTYFSNKIEADSDTDPTKIIYANLKGHAVSQGISLNIESVFDFPLRLNLGATLMESYSEHNQLKKQLYHAPKFTGNLLASYTFKGGFSSDLTMNLNGPMHLPRVENDYRSPYSPWTVMANIQITKSFQNGLELYGGVKNLLNTLPKSDVISRWWDPYGEPGNGVPVPDGRADVAFEPNDYSYTPNQGTRLFFGLRMDLN